MSTVLWILTTLALVAFSIETLDTNIAHQESAATKADLEMCRKQYVSAKDCQKWIADNLARDDERMVDEQKRSGITLSLHKVTNSDLQKCREQSVDAVDCQEWIAEQQARKQAHLMDKSSDKKRADAEKSPSKTVVAERVDSGRTTEAEASATKEKHGDVRFSSKVSQAISRAEQKAIEEKTQTTPAPSGGGWWPLMLASTDQVGKISNIQEKWCRSERVAEKDCEKWVADQMARQAARQADEEARKNARHADEEVRKAARQADEEARKEDGKHKEDEKSETAEPAILLADGIEDMNTAHQGLAETKTDLGLCREQYVDAKDCQKWIADNLARGEERLADESKSGTTLSLHKVTASDLQRCQEQFVDAINCQEWIAEQQARTQAHQMDKSSDKKQADTEKSLFKTVVAERVDSGETTEASEISNDAMRKTKEKVDVGRTTEASELSNDVMQQAKEEHNVGRFSSKAAQAISKAEQKALEEKPQTTSAPSSRGWWWPLMLASIDKMAKLPSKTVHEEWCRSERIAEKDCAKWVADQMARKAARQADEEARKNARHAEEKARKVVRKVDEEAREADEKSNNGEHEADDKSGRTELAVLLGIGKATTQPNVSLFSFLAASMLVSMLIATIVFVKGVFKRGHIQQSIQSPLLKESSDEV